jgi:hypothetical protein
VDPRQGPCTGDYARRFEGELQDYAGEEVTVAGDVE